MSEGIVGMPSGYSLTELWDLLDDPDIDVRYEFTRSGDTIARAYWQDDAANYGGCIGLYKPEEEKTMKQMKKKKIAASAMKFRDRASGFCENWEMGEGIFEEDENIYLIAKEEGEHVLYEHVCNGCRSRSNCCNDCDDCDAFE